jgi:FMN-dependent NADH-azoreductase
VIVLGAPMYNFGMPAQLKAWVDNIVRVGVTFGFDRTRPGEPYWPLLSEQRKTAIILTARGDYGYAPGERLAERELVIPGLSIPLNYIGITDIRHVAIEYDEFADDRLAASIQRAERAIDDLVGQLVTERAALTSIAA